MRARTLARKHTRAQASSQTSTLSILLLWFGPTSPLPARGRPHGPQPVSRRQARCTCTAVSAWTKTASVRKRWMGGWMFRCMDVWMKMYTQI